jgi:hypothetical protein
MADMDSNSSAQPNSEALPEWGAPAWENMGEDEFADKILAKMEGEQELITCDEMDIIERFWEQDRAVRRCALVSLTKPFTWLRENIERDTGFAEAEIEVFQSLDPGKYRAIAELLETAQKRLLVAVACREDMQVLMDKVEAAVRR